MSITVHSIVWDEADFAGGGYLDPVSLPEGDSYPRWQAFLVACLRDGSKALATSSASSVAIGTGAKSLTLALDLPFQPGMWVLIADQAAPATNWMHGQVTAKAGTAMTVNVAKTGGGGTKASWYVSLSGPQGEAGAPGSAPYGSTLPSALGSAATGSNAEAARIDHVHPATDLATGAVTGTLPVAHGGTGGTSGGAARAALGSSAVGDAVFVAASAAAARAALGSTTVGDAVFVAASQAAAQAAVGVGAATPGIADGRYYAPANCQYPTSLAVAVNRLYAVPFRTGATKTFNRVGIYVATAAGTLARLGLYTNADAAPAALIADLGTVATDTIGAKELTIGQQLDAGTWYWLAVLFDGTPTVRSYGIASTSYSSLELIGHADSSFSNEAGVYHAQTYGALPDPFGGSLTLAMMPLLWLRKV